MAATAVCLIVDAGADLDHLRSTLEREAYRVLDLVPLDAGALRALGRPREQPEVAGLSPRLRQTFDALMTGASEKRIADQLGISPHTTHQYIKTLFRCFGVTSRPELMARVLGR